MHTQYPEHLAYIDSRFHVLTIHSAYRDVVLEWMLTLSQEALKELEDLLITDKDDSTMSGPTRDFLEERGGEREWWYNIYRRAT